MQLTSLSFPSEWQTGAAQMAQAILAHDEYLVCAHANLDGDAISSMLAMGCFLTLHNKKFCYYAPHGVPSQFSFLSLMDKVYKSLDDLPFRPKIILAMDCGEPFRLGPALQSQFDQYACINIDHHVGTGMGTIATLVHAEAASTTQILASVFHASGLEPLPKDIATYIALGLITDTGGFRHANVTPSVFALVTYLMRCGVNIYALREELERNMSIAKLRLWSLLVHNIRIDKAQGLVFSSVNTQEIHSVGAQQEDIEGFVELLRNIRSVRVSAILREQGPSLCKFSLRSIVGINVRDIAASLGGGGHVSAAGGTLTLPYEKARDLLYTTIITALNAHKDESKETDQSQATTTQAAQA